MSKVIETGQFCTIRGAKYCDYGFKNGETVYVAGEFMSPVDEKDPYAFRKLFIAAKMVDGHVKAEEKPMSIDGLNLKAVSKKKQKELYEAFSNDYQQEEEES